jgi:tRNA(fMet)-specific endonuclease VapC
MKAADGNQLKIGYARLVQAEMDFRGLRVLGFTPHVADEFDRLRLERKLRTIGRADLLIASFALANKAALVSRNKKHFSQVPGLKLENWAD